MLNCRMALCFEDIYNRAIDLDTTEENGMFAG